MFFSSKYYESSFDNIERDMQLSSDNIEKEFKKIIS